MKLRTVVVPILVCLVIGGGVALVAPAQARTLQDEQMKQSILLLRGYIDREGGYDFWVFPTRSQVRLGGGLDAPRWPRDPWTGARMTPGSGRGHYTYWVSGDRRSYRLTGYLSYGKYSVAGGMPNSAKLAYNHRTREGAALLQQFIETWARANGGVYPPADEVGVHGSVGEQPWMPYWPSDPWNHAPMYQGTQRACFEYELAPDAKSYKLTMHLNWGYKMVLTNAPFDPLVGLGPRQSSEGKLQAVIMGLGGRRVGGL